MATHEHIIGRTEPEWSRNVNTQLTTTNNSNVIKYSTNPYGSGSGNYTWTTTTANTWPLYPNIDFDKHEVIDGRMLLKMHKNFNEDFMVGIISKNLVIVMNKNEIYSNDSTVMMAKPLSEFFQKNFEEFYNTYKLLIDA